MRITQSGAASGVWPYLRQSQDLLLTEVPWNPSGPLIWFRLYAVPRSYVPSVDGSRRTERLLLGRSGIGWLLTRVTFTTATAFSVPSRLASIRKYGAVYRFRGSFITLVINRIQAACGEISEMCLCAQLKEVIIGFWPDSGSASEWAAIDGERNPSSGLRHRRLNLSFRLCDQRYISRPGRAGQPALIGATSSGYLIVVRSNGDMYHMPGT